MCKINDLIIKLEKLEDRHGNVEINIYQSFDKKTTPIDIDQVYFDESLNDIYIGIY